LENTEEQSKKRGNICKKPKSNSEKIWEIRRKASWIVKWYGTNRRQLWNDIENMEENGEMIWKIWKKAKLNSDKIGKIHKKS
jgi:hypothetical protein